MVIKFKARDFPRRLSSSEFEDLLRLCHQCLHPSRPQLLPKTSPKPHLKNPAA